MTCTHDTIDACIEVGPASSTIRFARGQTHPDDPPGVPLRRISISDLVCADCGKRLTRSDVGKRFDVGGDFYHPRFNVHFG